jgi:hypothetical protein
MAFCMHFSMTLIVILVEVVLTHPPLTSFRDPLSFAKARGLVALKKLLELLSNAFPNQTTEMVQLMIKI